MAKQEKKAKKAITETIERLLMDIKYDRVLVNEISFHCEPEEVDGDGFMRRFRRGSVYDLRIVYTRRGE